MKKKLYKCVIKGTNDNLFLLQYRADHFTHAVAISNAFSKEIERSTDDGTVTITILTEIPEEEAGWSE